MNNKSLIEYLESLHTKKSADSYHYSIVKFLSTNPNAESYGYQDVLDYLLELKQQRLSDTYRSKVLSSIKKYYDFLLYIGVRDRHPCRSLRIKDNRKKGTNFEDLFTTEELERLLIREERYRYLGHRNRFLISLLIYQGLTQSEIMNLNVQDIDVDGAKIRVKASRRLTGRTLAMHRTQVVLAIKYIEESRPFLMREDKPTNKLIISKLGDAESEDGIKALLKTMKILFPFKNITAQNIRKSVIANWLNERKIPLEDVQLMAGHKWPSTTERYRRADMEEQRRLINAHHPLND